MSTIAENLTKLAEDRDNIATAISSKGVTVPEGSKLSEFPEMIEGISTGGSPDFVGDNWACYPIVANSSMYAPALIILNEEFHLISDYYHYKLSGKQWISVSSVPNGAGHYLNVILYNNEIHILGGNYSPNQHYKWNGSSWVSVSTLPYDFKNGGVVVYNNEIHILGGSATSPYTKHYKWNGSKWTYVSKLPYSYYGLCPVVYNNEIHIIGSSDGYNYKKHCKWNGTTWTQLTDLSTIVSGGWGFVVKDDVIHALSSSNHMCYSNSLNMWINIKSNTMYAIYPIYTTVLYDGYFISVGCSTTTSSSTLYMQTYKPE